MKKWQPEVVEPVLKQIVDVPKVVFECVSCYKPAVAFYQGTSYCRMCVAEKIRIGR